LMVEFEIFPERPNLDRLQIDCYDGEYFIFEPTGYGSAAEAAWFDVENVDSTRLKGTLTICVAKVYRLNVIKDGVYEGDGLKLVEKYLTQFHDKSLVKFVTFARSNGGSLEYVEHPEEGFGDLFLHMPVEVSRPANSKELLDELKPLIIKIYLLQV